MDEVYAISYNQVNTIAVSLLTNSFITLPVTTRNIIEARRETGTNIATVRIRDNDFDFDLKPGQNFYFVLIKDEDGEQFVTVK